MVLDVTVLISNNPHSVRTWLSTNQNKCGRRAAPGTKGRMCRREQAGLRRSRDCERLASQRGAGDVNIVYGAFVAFLENLCQ